jgi:hypothetical protein
VLKDNTDNTWGQCLLSLAKALVCPVALSMAAMGARSPKRLLTANRFACSLFVCLTHISRTPLVVSTAYDTSLLLRTTTEGAHTESALCQGSKSLTCHNNQSTSLMVVRI